MYRRSILSIHLATLGRSYEVFPERDRAGDSRIDVRSHYAEQCRKKKREKRPREEKTEKNKKVTLSKFILTLKVSAESTGERLTNILFRARCNNEEN